MKRTKLSLIFSVIGALGAIATGALATCATIKAVKILEKDGLQLKDIPLDMETVKQVWKSYILPASVAAVAAGSVCIAHGINHKMIFTLASGVLALSESYGYYRNRVIDENSELNDRISEEMSNGHWVTPDGHDMGEKVIFYEPYSQRMFERTWYEISDAFYHFNRNFALRGYGYLNELYDFLDIPRTVDGGVLGYYHDWFYEGGLLPWVDYEIVKEKQGRETVHTISFTWPAVDLHELEEVYPMMDEPEYYISPT